jgi:peptidoglycan/LPS O-acetylase OafA/YrhL
MGDPLSRSWGLALAVAWVVVVAVGMAVEPAPANPDAPVPLVADLLSTGLMATWGAMAAGIFQRRRFAAAASVVGGLGLLALTVACPASGHHGGIGAWWGVQMVGVVGLLALSGRALRSS